MGGSSRGRICHSDGFFTWIFCHLGVFVAKIFCHLEVLSGGGVVTWRFCS